jgi:peptidoglycan/LPS O-acetylase OafA/YrhL
MRKQSIIAIFAGTAAILLIPLIMMQVSNEWDWDLRDFVIIGVLLIGMGFVYELVATRLHKKYRPLIALLVMTLVILIWAELAVGIFGTPFAGS